VKAPGGSQAAVAGAIGGPALVSLPIRVRPALQACRCSSFTLFDSITRMTSLDHEERGFIDSCVP
jgi:hypothetical protein